MRYIMFFVLFFQCYYIVCGADTGGLTQLATSVLDGKCDNKKSYIIEPIAAIEYYQLLLFEFIYSHINLDHLACVKINSLISRKSQTWNLFEVSAVILYALSHKKYRKYLIFALERMYVLSGDAYLSELALWNLANEYERYDKLKPACELYGQFKKIFPGSQFYWLSRYKEIMSAYKISKEEFLDITQNSFIIDLIKDYIVDKAVLEEDHFNDIITVLHDLSFKMIKKHIHNIQHYIKKYSYTNNLHTILSSWQRLDTTLNDIQFFLDICAFEEDHYKKNKLYYSICLQLQSMISDFFAVHSIPLPCGQEYIEMHENTMRYIKRHQAELLRDLDSVCNKILLAIELYYGR
jgi:hypothetical protein